MRAISHCLLWRRAVWSRGQLHPRKKESFAHYPSKHAMTGLRRKRLDPEHLTPALCVPHNPIPIKRTTALSLLAGRESRATCVMSETPTPSLETGLLYDRCE